MQSWLESEVWDRVAAELRAYRADGFGAILTEDVLRFATARSLATVGCQARSLRVERPHPCLPGSRIDLVVENPPAAVIEFKYPREPNEKNAAWTMVLGEVLKDVYRLAVYPGDADRIFVLATTSRLREYLSRSVGRYGMDLDRDHVSLEAAAAAVLPRTAASIIGAELREHHVTATRLHVMEVDSELRVSVYLVDPVAKPSNGLVALAAVPRSDVAPRSGPIHSASERALAESSAKNATGTGKYLTIWDQLEKCATQLDEPFRRSEIIGWFRRHYPETNELSLGAHIQAVTVNGGHAKGQFATRRPLLFRVEHGWYRRYRSDTD